MSLLKEMRKQLVARSERVKCVDLHPKEPLVLASLYTGQVTLWNYETQLLVKSFEIVELPVRCAKFIVRLQSFACGADDFLIRVFNYNTMEKSKTFEAHQDYIRSLAVHDQLPYLLSSSDDMTIKMWDWSKGWTCVRIFQGHEHYVMQVTFNPKDPTTFASASLDKSLKVWSISSPEANFTLYGHGNGTNSVQYYPGGDKPYLISGSDDREVRVWDYQTKACIQTLSHHVHNVPCVLFYPDLPLVVTGSEDETVSFYNMQTWRQEQTANYGLQRCWTIDAKAGLGVIAIGFDKGLVVLRISKDEPVVSMDPNGKILIVNHQEISRMEIKGIGDRDVVDGDVIGLPSKEIGTIESIAQRISYGPSSQYIAVLTDTEYTINSALAWRPKAFGAAVAFVWGSENGTFAILENPTLLKTFRQFKAKGTHKLALAGDMLFGGPLLGIRCEGCVILMDWETFEVVRKIDVYPRDVVWSDSGELVALISDTGTFILKFNAASVAAYFEKEHSSPPDGIEFSFDVVEELEEKVKQAQWIGDCLVYVNGADRLNYYIGGEVTTIAVLPRTMFLLGFVARESRIFLIDKERNVVSYQLFISVIEYKTAIVRGNIKQAEAIRSKIPDSMRLKVAQFLQARGFIELAFEMTPDEEHRFDLSVQLGSLSNSLEIARRSPNKSRWKQIGDLALELAHFDIAEEALQFAEDFNGLLLLYTSTNNMEKLSQLGAVTAQKGLMNTAFTCFHLTGNYSACIDALCATHKVAEAAFYARTYLPERMDDLVLRWKNAVAGIPRVRDSLADPATYPNLFPESCLQRQSPVKSASAKSTPHSSPDKPQDSPPKPEASPPKAESSPPKAESSPPKAESSPKHESPPKSAPKPPPRPPAPAAVDPNDEFEEFIGGDVPEGSHTVPPGAAAPQVDEEDLDDLWDPKDD